MIICILVIAAVLMLQTVRMFSGKIFLQRFLAGLILIVPYIFVPSQAHYLRISFDKLNVTLFASAVMAMIAIISTGLVVRNSEHFKLYPQLKPQQWTTKLVTLNALSWSGYLIGYEILLRGYLLFSCMLEFSFPISMLVNLVIYGIANLHRSEREFLLSIPFGAILCYSVYVTGNVWPAVFGHIVVALSNDYFSYKASKKILAWK